MRSEDAKTWLGLGLIAIFFIVGVVGAIRHGVLSHRCNERGGEYVRGAFGVYRCIKGQEV